MDDYTPRMLTPEEFAQEMQSLGGDEEGAHIEADRLMCELLMALGYTEGVRVFADMVRWYA